MRFDYKSINNLNYTYKLFATHKYHFNLLVYAIRQIGEFEPVKDAARERSFEEAVQLRPDVAADARQRQGEIHALEDERVETRQQSAHTRRAALQLLERVHRLELRVESCEMGAR